MLQTIETVNSFLGGIVWGPVMLVLLVGTGIYLTIRCGFLQARRFGFILRNTIGTLFSKQKSQSASQHNLTPFQAVTTALAGTVGTGNIAGVTGAIFAGGPGAVFWMWVSAFFGMMTKYAEIVLAVRYRQVDEKGAHFGGPMYYIEKGAGLKWLAVIFALLGGVACFGIGNIAQSTEIAGAMESLVGLEPIYTGIILAVITAVVVIGGVKRIGQVTSYLVPFMAIFYIVAGVAIILLRITHVPAALASIFTEAFSFDLREMGGGVLGYTIMVAMQQGFARGVFSNEAGLGSAPMAHAASDTKEPVEQGMWGVFEVFVDTIVICTLTSMAVLLSGVLEYDLSSFSSNGAAAAAAFNAILPGTIGGTVLQISLLFFALSTILGWSYYGERCWGYLTNNNKVVNLVFKIAFALVCVVGAVGSGQLMWNISDTLNGMMAIPNLVGLLLLSGTVIKLTKEYFSKHYDTTGAACAAPVFASEQAAANAAAFSFPTRGLR